MAQRPQRLRLVNGVYRLENLEHLERLENLEHLESLDDLENLYFFVACVSKRFVARLRAFR